MKFRQEFKCNLILVKRVISHFTYKYGTEIYCGHTGVVWDSVLSDIITLMKYLILILSKESTVYVHKVM